MTLCNVRAALPAMALFALMATPALAQRELNWDAVAVDASLDAAGTLHVEETQTIVFDGDWNGGERAFNIRPRQRFSFLGIYRDEGGTWKPLSEDDFLDDVDEYSWSDGETLRWRSRLPSDAPFDNTRIRYQLRYELSNILLQDGDRFVLDHDFLFPERDGVIRRFDLRLTLADVWQHGSQVRETYAARDVAPGNGFVLTLHLGYTGAGNPSTLDTSRPRNVQYAVFSILVVTLLCAGWVFVREGMRGRFATLDPRVDEAWLREHVLNIPAEVVGAAWDETIASPEVVSLIARMVSEGKLESTVGKAKNMSLRLKVDRETLAGHERVLVDRLFFNNRTNTSTQLVKQHYRKKGFDPAGEITKELRAAVHSVTPDGERRRPFRYATRILLPAGLILLVADWTQGRLVTPMLFVLGVGALVLVAIALNVGTRFRWNIHWGRGAALLCLLSALVPAITVAIVLWSYVGVGEVSASTMLIAAITLLTLAIVSACLNAMVARQHRAGIAFRKRLAAARAFFIRELEKPQPALRDEWSPWLLALGLGQQMDDWSAQQPTATRGSRSQGWSSSASSESSSSSTGSSASWTGFAGGRSGGAGGGAAWNTAASGLAAGVAAPSSSSSSGGGSSSGSSSSSGGSSGGGGGGGW